MTLLLAILVFSFSDSHFGVFSFSDSHDDGIGSAQYHDKDLLSIEDEVNNTTKSIIDSDFSTRF